MGQYLLLLQGHAYVDGDYSPAEIQRIIDDYGAWRHELEEEERLVGANKLADEGGRLLAMEGETVRVLDGPFTESKEVVSGYFLIRAEDYEEAVAVSRRCPHLRYGGTIAVRAIDTLES